jgi:STE24 endopeptidase
MQRCGFCRDWLRGRKQALGMPSASPALARPNAVVFYDTLLNQLNPAEVDAVLAHGPFRPVHHQTDETCLPP